MDYKKLHKRLDDMLEFESDNFFVNINLSDEISNKLYDYQVLHVLNLVTAFRSNRCILDGSDTGTGKTYTSVAICKHLRYRPLVVCPRSVMSAWKDVCKLFNVEPLTIVNYETIKLGKQYDLLGNRIESKYVKIDDSNKDRYVWDLPKNSVVIFDEAHKCKNPKSHNGKLLMSLKNKANVIILSATLADKPETFHIFGYMLNFYKNMRQAKNWINGMLREDKNFINAAPKMSAISKQIYPHHGSRISISELGSKFPENQVSVDCYDLDKKDQTEIDDLFKNIDVLNNEIVKNQKIGHKITKYKKKLEKTDDLKEIEKLTKHIKKLESRYDFSKNAEILNRITKERMNIELLKVPIFEALIEDYLDNDYNVVVFVNFRRTLEMLCEKFKTDCVVYGGVSNEKQMSNISKFQENKTNLIICTVGAGSEGISLHDKYGKPRVSLISPSFSSNKLLQTLGRICRAGQKTPALQRIIYCANTYEKYIVKNLKSKLEFTSKINDVFKEMSDEDLTVSGKLMNKI